MVREREYGGSVIEPSIIDHVAGIAGISFEIVDLAAIDRADGPTIAAWLREFLDSLASTSKTKADRAVIQRAIDLLETED